MAKSGMNIKIFQYLTEHSDIGVMLNTYTGGCHRQTSEDGRVGREDRFIEDVLGDLIYGESVRPALAGNF